MESIKNIVTTFWCLMIVVVFIYNAIKLITDKKDVIKRLTDMLLSFITGPLLGILITFIIILLLFLFSLSLLLTPFDLIINKKFTIVKKLINEVKEYYYDFI